MTKNKTKKEKDKEKALESQLHNNQVNPNIPSDCFPTSSNSNFQIHDKGNPSSLHIRQEELEKRNKCNRSITKQNTEEKPAHTNPKRKAEKVITKQEKQTEFKPGSEDWCCETKYTSIGPSVLFRKICIIGFQKERRIKKVQTPR